MQIIILPLRSDDFNNLRTFLERVTVTGTLECEALLSIKGSMNRAEQAHIEKIQRQREAEKKAKEEAEKAQAEVAMEKAVDDQIKKGPKRTRNLKAVKKD